MRICVDFCFCPARIDCQNDLSASITKLNSKSKLHVLREAPQTLLPKLFKAWKISHLVFEKDTDAYARSRDEDVIAQAKKAGVQVVTRMGRTLYDPDEVVKANGGKPTMNMNAIQAVAGKLGDVAKPLPAPKEIPDPGDTSLEGVEMEKPDPDPDFMEGKRGDKGETSYEKLAGPKGDFAVPTIEELGLPPSTSPHRGGETRALEVLEKIIKDEDYTAMFSKPSTAPTAFDPQSTTLVSPHHHFGSLSVRLLWWRVQDVLSTYPKVKQSTIPTNLPGQLLFRDMYFGAQAKLGFAFHQTLTNPTVRFVPWHLPSKCDPKTHINTGEGYEVDDPQAEEWYIRWREGRTGFPWIDALMRQLKQEGWIHHLGRHAVACFLTRGGCYVHWERGLETFEEWLLDHEAACNAGNWQWLSCTAFFAQFYRCYSPIAFPKKWDAKGSFVRRYVPELANIPDKYIYEPSRAPIADQKKAGVLIKGDGTQTEDCSLKLYPKPMFDFNERRDVCINGIKAAYDTKLYGDNPKVLDGSWRTLFDDDAEGPTKSTGKANGGVKRKRGREQAEDVDCSRADEHVAEGEEEDEDEEGEDDNERGDAKSTPKKSRRGAQKGQGTLDCHLSNGSSKGHSGARGRCRNYA